MCALAGVDPVGVINAGPEDRDVLVEAAIMAHKLMEEANKKAARK
jgi:hypothetical protein